MSDNQTGMNRAIDFEKVRKRRQRFTTLKRILILAGVTLVACAVLLANQIFVEESLTTTLSDFAESLGGSGFPVDLPGGVIRAVDSVGSNLTVLNDTNLYIYSPKGKIVKNVQKMTELGAAEMSGSRILTFAIGNRDFAVHSLSRELYKGTLEFGILCGDINGQGDFALVSQIKQFASKTIVYNRHFEEIYSWSSPEYVTSVAVSPKGDMMAANCVSSDGGRLESLIYMFRFSQENQEAKVALTLYDNLVLDLIFTEDDRVVVLTDKQLLILNALGEIKCNYDFADGQILAMERAGREILLLLKSADGKKNRLVLLDANLSETSGLDSSSEIRDMALGKDSVYILSSAGIGAYDRSFELKAKLNRRNISNIHAAGAKLYYLTPDEIYALSPSELTAVPIRQTSQTAAQRLRDSLTNRYSDKER